MKNLVLIRHAKSSWDDPGLSDVNRPLNKRGKRDAPLVGSLLRVKGLFPDLIVASPAKRARKTAIRIAKVLGYPQSQIEIRDAIYLQGVSALMELITALPDDKSRVFLVGHNPELTDLANILAGVAIDNIPTCGVVSIEFPCSEWRQVPACPGVLAMFERPLRQREED